MQEELAIFLAKEDYKLNEKIKKPRIISNIILTEPYSMKRKRTFDEINEQVKTFFNKNNISLLIGENNSPAPEIEELNMDLMENNEELLIIDDPNNNYDQADNQHVKKKFCSSKTRNENNNSEIEINENERVGRTLSQTPINRKMPNPVHSNFRKEVANNYKEHRELAYYRKGKGFKNLQKTNNLYKILFKLINVFIF